MGESINKVDILSMTYGELEEYFLNINEKSFRAKQTFKWLHSDRVKAFDDMSNLSKGLRENLSENTYINNIESIDVLTSKEDGTKKFLFELMDGNVIESVFMRYHHGNSVCISTQVGCAMGCKFCASTLDGLTRNLTASEMLSQVYEISRITGERISNIVLMGSGEPLHNYDNVLKFIELITDENGYNLSGRNITLSTCGIVPNIYKLADCKLQITLAISLHSTTDERRKTLMPIANKYSIDEILKATDYFFEQTGRRISFEYCLVANENDTMEDANRLSKLLNGRNAHVNLIPVNPIKERDFKSTNMEFVHKFKNVLEKNGINVTIRREMGRDINGACGQLRKSYIDSKGGKNR